MFYVYILQSRKTGRRYIGRTNDLERRLAEHNAGRTRSLWKHRPLEIIYIEEYPTLQAARERETQIKSYKSGNAFKKLLAKDNPRLRRGVDSVDEFSSSTDSKIHT